MIAVYLYLRNCFSFTCAFIFPSMRTEFGQRLLQARKRAKRTQVQVCAAVGMAQGGYTQLETSGQGSSYTPKIAAYLGVSVNWLAYGQGDMLEDAPLVEPPSSYEGERFTRWLYKIKDRDLRERACDAAMQILYSAYDGQWPLPKPTPEQAAPSKKQRGEPQEN